MNSSKSGRRPRRKQHGRAPSNPPRRKHKKPPSDFIEEQLRVQRKKRALENKTLRNEPQATLGNYRYDAERDAYFPADSFPKDRKRPAKNHGGVKKQQNYTQCANAKCLLSTGAMSSQSLKYATEISTFATRQHNLRSLWAGRLTRMGMQVIPSVVTSTDGTRVLSMLPPLTATSSTSNAEAATLTSTALDLVCKNRLHPSARTFDVHMGTDHNLLPSIATLVDGGSHVMFGHRPEVWTVQDDSPPSHFDSVSLRISPVPDSGYVLLD